MPVDARAGREIVGAGKVQYTATLVSGIGLNTEAGCAIRGPARLVCVPVSKTSVTPTPPGGGPTAGTPPAYAVVQSVETADPQSSVMVYTNPESDVTVVWVFGLENTET